MMNIKNRRKDSRSRIERSPSRVKRNAAREERKRLDRIYGPDAAPKGWDRDIWVKMWQIALRLSYPHLVLAWIDFDSESKTNLDPRLEVYCQRNLRLIADTSREGMLEFFYEIGPVRACAFVDRYRHLLEDE